MITLMSWGFKFSRPEANFSFDVSFLKNPWREKEIRNENNKEFQSKLIKKFMEAQQETMEFATNIVNMIMFLNTYFKDETIKIAICCSAGEYRSPAVCQIVSEMLEEIGVEHLLEQSEQSKL